MTHLEAGQILYARLRKEQSPMGKAGYQTIAYTRSRIAAHEIPDIESRFLYYPAEQSPAKRVCFPTRSGQLVLAQVVRLSERDEHGRMIGLAHGLVFAADAFADALVTPLSVLDSHEFVTDLQTALQRSTANDLPTVPVRLLAEDPAWAAAARWPSAELEKLAFYALRADRLAERRTALAFCGTPEAILDGLRVAQLVLPAARYRQCPLDTYFVDEHGNPGNLYGVYCWAVGLPEPPRAGSFVTVDAVRCQVLDNPTWKPGDGYELWLADRLAARPFTEIAADKEHAWHFARALAGETLTRPIPETVVTNVQRVAPEIVRAAVRDRIARDVGPVLADRLLDRIGPTLRPADLARVLQTGFEMSVLLQQLLASYASCRFASPPAQEMVSLQQLLPRCPPTHLGFLSAIWSGDEATQAAAAGAYDPAAYQQVVRSLLAAGFAQPLVLAQPERGVPFVRAWLSSPQAGSIPLPALVARLLEVDAADALDELTGLLPRQDEETLEAVQRVCKRSKRVSRAFRETLEQALEQAREASGTGSFWRRLLGGGPRR
jgi:hypothetical protein